MYVYVCFVDDGRKRFMYIYIYIYIYMYIYVYIHVRIYISCPYFRYVKSKPMYWLSHHHDTSLITTEFNVILPKTHIAARKSLLGPI